MHGFSFLGLGSAGADVGLGLSEETPVAAR